MERICVALHSTPLQHTGCCHVPLLVRCVLRPPALHHSLFFTLWSSLGAAVLKETIPGREGVLPCIVIAGIPAHPPVSFNDELVAILPFK